jgi:hypothetical protein
VSSRPTWVTQHDPVSKKTKRKVGGGGRQEGKKADRKEGRKEELNS